QVLGQVRRGRLRHGHRDPARPVPPACRGEPVECGRMTALGTAASFLAGTHGILVNRATASLPATTTASLFTISTGRILLTSIVGEVTTVIQTQADNTKLQFDPTDAGATQDLCAVLDITADAVGTMYSITGTPGTAMQDS